MKNQYIKLGDKYLVCFAFSNEKTADEFANLAFFLLDSLKPKAEDTNTAEK